MQINLCAHFHQDRWLLTGGSLQRQLPTGWPASQAEHLEAPLALLGLLQNWLEPLLVAIAGTESA